MKKILFLPILLFCFVVTCKVSGQIPIGSAGIPSPNVTSLGMISEVPVSLYTGKCNITIPVYELKEGDITVPIYLTYNSSGVKPNVHPGWTGMNWALQAGGMITRVVKGLPDETDTRLDHNGYWSLNGYVYPINHSYRNKAGYLYNHDKNAQTNWSTTDAIAYLANEDPWKDTEPDVFSFNINGITATFYMGENGKFYCRSYPDIKIEIEDEVLATVHFPDYKQVYYDGGSGNWLTNRYSNLTNRKISGFMITMNDGFRYTFGHFGEIINGTDSLTLIERSVNFFDQIYLIEHWNTWMLRKIESPNGVEVTFNYQHGQSEMNRDCALSQGGKQTIKTKYTHPVVSFHDVIAYNKTVGSNKETWIDKIFFPFSGSIVSSLKTSYHNFSGEIIFPVYLSSIETNTQKLEFSISPTNELKYNYTAIVQNLADQIGINYHRLIWSKSPRTVLSKFYYNECTYPGIDANCANGFDVAVLRSDLYNDDSDLLLNIYNRNVPIFNEYAYLICNTSSSYFSGDSLLINYLPIAPPIYEGIDLDYFKWFKLDSISLYSKSESQYLKKWKFGYNNKSTERLMLLSLQEEGENDSSKNPYIFEYEDYYGADKYSGNNILPAYNQPLLDHWGYFNGTDSKITPSTINSTIMRNYYDKRNANPTYMYAGQLNRIIYPQGGSIEFTYEPNRYSTEIKRNYTTGNFERTQYTQVKTGGGLRIKNIKYKDGDLVKMEKSYTYSDGILGQEIKYYWDNYKGILTSNPNATYTAERFVSENLLPGCGGLDYSVSYPKVEETVSDMGKTEYYYSNHFTNPDENFIATIDNYKSISSPFSSKDFERGHLLRKIVKDVNGIIKHKESYKYNKNSNVQKEYIPAVATWRFMILNANWSTEGASYKNYIYPYNMTERIDSIYDLSGNYLTRTVNNYEHNSHNLLTWETSNANNDLVKKSYKYPFDLRNTYPFEEMINFNILSPVVEQYQYKNSIQISSKVNEYNNWSNGIYAIKKIYLQKGNLPREERTVFHNYDRHGNPAYFIKDNAEKTVYLWGYSGQYPIAEIKGATYAEVTAKIPYFSLDSIAGKLLPSDSDFERINNLRIQLPSAQVTTYTYKPLVGMLTTTDARGVTTYYDYDDFGRLKETYYYENGVKTLANKRKVEEYKYHYRQ